MRLSILSLTIVFLALSACTSVPTAPKTPSATEPTTSWYGGTTQVSSPDGTIPYGAPQEALVARTVDQAHQRIMEVVVDEGALRSLMLERQGATNVFSASDEAKSFSGTVTMEGADWNFSGWSYDLSLTDGSGKIVGTATIGAAGIQTEKYLVGPGGEVKIKVVDQLYPVSSNEYEARLGRLLRK